jgi:hypothetical protein
MTADYKYVASYDIRKTLLNELISKGLIDLNNYMADGFSQALQPIIPAQQVPEFNNMLPGKTYIIYDVSQSHGSTQWWMSEDVITFDVVSRDPSEIQTIINLITDFFRRYDDSAKDVNLSLISTSPYRYHYFKVESADPVQAFANEGGFMNGMISVRYAYSRALDPITGRYI